jgi:hypothetical protein
MQMDSLLLQPRLLPRMNGCQRKRRELSAEEEAEMKQLWGKLVRLFHPDRYQDNPEKLAIYQRLTAEINQARDQGDLDRLRDIAADPNDFLLRQGMSGLDFGDEDGAPRLRRLYEGLQAQILEAIQNLTALRESADHELYSSSSRDPQWLQEISNVHAEGLRAEIAQFGREAANLADEIETLTGEKVF